MKLKIPLIILSIISVISGVVAYLATNNIIIGLAILLIFISYLLLAYRYLLQRYNDNVQKMHECYNFINTFIITMSVKNSLSEAFDSATINASGTFKEEISHLDNVEILEKIRYLNHYFNFNIYQMFLNILSAYLEQGGNILKISELLLEELTRIENAQNEFESQGKSKLIEFALLWIFTYIILVFVRIALNEFYNQIVSSIFYQLAICFFFIFVLFSIHLSLQAYTGLKLKIRRKNNEQN